MGTSDFWINAIPVSYIKYSTHQATQCQLNTHTFNVVSETFSTGTSCTSIMEIITFPAIFRCNLSTSTLLQDSKFSEQCCTATFLWKQMWPTLWRTLHFCEPPKLMVTRYCEGISNSEALRTYSISVTYMEEWKNDTGQLPSACFAKETKYRTQQKRVAGNPFGSQGPPWVVLQLLLLLMLMMKYYPVKLLLFYNV